MKLRTQYRQQALFHMIMQLFGGVPVGPVPSDNEDDADG